MSSGAGIAAAAHVPTEPFIVGVPTTTAATTGAPTFTWPTDYSPVAGDVAYLVRETNQTGGLAAPSGFANITGSPRAQGSNVTSLTVQRKVLTGSESGSGIACSAASDHQVGHIVIVRGMDTTTLEEVTAASGLASPNDMSATGVTTLGPRRLVLIFSACAADVGTDNYDSLANSNLAGLDFVCQSWTAGGNGGGAVTMAGLKLTTGATGTTTANPITDGATSNIVAAVKAA